MAEAVLEVPASVEAPPIPVRVGRGTRPYKPRAKMALRAHRDHVPDATPPRIEARWLVCPRCTGAVVQEPGASRCRMCGRIGYLAGCGLEQQDFEGASGLAPRMLRTRGTTVFSVRAGRDLHSAD